MIFPILADFDILCTNFGSESGGVLDVCICSDLDRDLKHNHIYLDAIKHVGFSSRAEIY